MSDTSYLDWPFLDASHRDLAGRIAQWAEAEIAPTADDEPEDDAALDTACRALVRKLASDGWLGYGVPGAGRQARRRQLARLLRAGAPWRAF